MEFTIFDVMLILVAGTVILLGVVTMVFFSVDWAERIRARRMRKDKLQPLLGVVLPKEDDRA